MSLGKFAVDFSHFEFFKPKMDEAVDPAILRRYELENQVGKGSYGVVWSVSFLRSARWSLVKIN